MVLLRILRIFRMPVDIGMVDLNTRSTLPDKELRKRKCETQVSEGTRSEVERLDSLQAIDETQLRQTAQSAVMRIYYQYK